MTKINFVVVEEKGKYNLMVQCTELPTDLADKEVSYEKSHESTGLKLLALMSEDDREVGKDFEDILNWAFRLGLNCQE